MANLTASQRLMLRCSGHDPRDSNGYGVPLRTAGNWRTARALEARQLGWIESACLGHASQFFANRDGIAAVTPDDEPV